MAFFFLSSALVFAFHGQSPSAYASIPIGVTGKVLAMCGNMINMPLPVYVPPVQELVAVFTTKGWWTFGRRYASCDGWTILQNGTAILKGYNVLDAKSFQCNIKSDRLGLGKEYWTTELTMIMATSSRVVAFWWIWDGGMPLEGPPSTNCLLADVPPPKEIAPDIVNGTYFSYGYLYFWSAHHIAKLYLDGHAAQNCTPTKNSAWEVIPIPSQEQDTSAHSAVFSESRFSRSVRGRNGLTRRETWAYDGSHVSAPAYYLSEIVNVRSQYSYSPRRDYPTYAWVQKVNSIGMLFFGENHFHSVTNWAVDEGTFFCK